MHTDAGLLLIQLQIVVSIDTDWHSIVPLLYKEEKRQVNSFEKILVLSLFLRKMCSLGAEM